MLLGSRQRHHPKKIDAFPPAILSIAMKSRNCISIHTLFVNKIMLNIYIT